MISCAVGMSLLLMVGVNAQAQKLVYDHDWLSAHWLRYALSVEQPGLSACAQVGAYTIRAGLVQIDAGKLHLASGVNFMLDVCSESVCWSHISNGTGDGQGVGLVGLQVRF